MGDLINESRVDPIIMLKFGFLILLKKLAQFALPTTIC